MWLIYCIQIPALEKKTIYNVKRNSGEDAVSVTSSVSVYQGPKIGSKLYTVAVHSHIYIRHEEDFKVLKLQLFKEKVDGIYH